ncbi:hypothetical protein ACHAWX_003164 [Stephanocyclus meneghinianus]
MAQEPLSHTTSLTSLREDGLFTGEEVTIKFVGDEQILAVLVEAEEERSDEGENNSSSSPSSPSAAVDLASKNGGGVVMYSPPTISTTTTTTPSHAEESSGEGVDAILIENYHPNLSSGAASLDVASSDEQEYNIHHYIATSAAEAELKPSSLQGESTASPSKGGKRIAQIKRSIARKMNRAAFRMKAAVSRNVADAISARTEGTNSTVGSGGEEIDCYSHEGAGESFPSTDGLELTTPEEESVSLRTHSSVVINRPSNNANLDTNSTVRSTTSVANDEETDLIEYDIIHTSQNIIVPSLNISSEQIDPTYTGPYDDNKSLVTCSTGDFDTSQLYSRSWSTVAQSISGSKFVLHRSPSNRSFHHCPIGEDDILNLSMPGSGANQRSNFDKEEDCVSLDGLSLVNSIVGDDRSYVEDY